MLTMPSRMDMPPCPCPRTRSAIKAPQSTPPAPSMDTAPPHPLSIRAAPVNITAAPAHPASTKMEAVQVPTSIKTRIRVAPVPRIRARAVSIPVHLTNLARAVVTKRAVQAVIKREVQKRKVHPTAVVRIAARAVIKRAPASTVHHPAATSTVHHPAATSIKMAAAQNIAPHPPLNINTKRSPRRRPTN